MTLSKTAILSLFLIPCLQLGAQAQGAAVKTYQTGSAVAAFNANDQHGKAYTFKKGTRYLLLSFDMGTGKKANKVLTEKGAAYLPGKKAVYVANIFGMPGIGRAFALPKMRRYAHTIILADQKDLLAPFPTQKGKVTILALNPAGVVTGISYWDPAVKKIDDVMK